MKMRRNSNLLIEPPASATGDIAFNLIVFFLVCASVQPDSGRKQTLPKAEETKEEKEESENIEVQIKRQAVIINGDAVRDEEFFVRIKAKLETLHQVGLGYVHLGQSATTLSGGEAQRVKLATELSKRATGQTLYILDEPTTGLHFEDVRVLLEVLHRLVELGNTVIVIEHNLHVVKTADWIIDLGPEGGSGGGLIIAEGTPEDVAATKASYTGQHLAPMLGS